MRKSTQIALTLLSFCVLGVQAQPSNQPPPPVYDAGALMRQIEQNTRQSQMQRGLQTREALPPAAVLNESTLVTAQSFKFNGNKLLTAEQLQAVAAPYANRPLNSHDLERLTHALSEAYRHTGWLVQAYIPRQDLTKSELTLQLIESIPPSKPGQ